MHETAERLSPTYSQLLENRNFAALWLGQLVSTLGDRLHQVALLVLVGSLTGQNLNNIALVSIAIGLPTVLFGLFAGALVDTMDRKRVMIASDLARFALVLCIVPLARLDLRWVYAVTFLLTTVSLFFRPARGAVLPEVVEGEHLLRANSFVGATDNVMDVLGYPLAGALVVGLSGALTPARGVEVAFYLDAATYLISAALVARVTLARAKPVEVGARLLGGMVLGGLHFVRSHPVLLTNTVLFTLAPLLGASVNTLSYGYAVQVTHTDGFGYSVLEGAIGLGSVLGGLWVGRYGGRFATGPAILLGLVLIGCGMTALAVVDSLWIAAVLLVVGGAGNIVAFILSLTLIQQQTPGDLLGRVLGLRGLLISVAVIASNALAGVGAQRYGVQPMFALFGGSLVLIALLAFLLPSARLVDPARTGP